MQLEQKKLPLNCCTIGLNYTHMIKRLENYNVPKQLSKKCI